MVILDSRYKVTIPPPPNKYMKNLTYKYIFIGNNETFYANTHTHTHSTLIQENLLCYFYRSIIRKQQQCSDID